MSLLDDLISHWKLNEASGTRADAHGSNDLTDNNTVGVGTGKLDNAADFERDTSEYLSITDNADLSTGDVDFTVAGWVKFETAGATNVGVMGKWAQPVREYGIDIASGKFRWIVSHDSTNAVVATDTTSVTTGVWYFVVAWHDAANNQIGISVNDNTPTTVSHSSGVHNGAAEFRLGRFDATHMDGLLDSWSFWKRVLTAAERTALYNGGDGLDYDFAGGTSQLPLVFAGRT